MDGVRDPALAKELSRLKAEEDRTGRRGGPRELAARLREHQVTVPASELQWFAADLLRGFGGPGDSFVPPLVLDVVGSLLSGRSARLSLDPWAGVGVLAGAVHQVTHAERTVACTQSAEYEALGRVLTPQLDWRLGSMHAPLEIFDGLTDPVDVIASVLPFGVRAPYAIEACDGSGEDLRVGDLASALVVASSLRLSSDGVGVFVVTPSFFFAGDSVVPNLTRFGLSIEAALALPARTFAPYTTIPSYLVVVRRQALTSMFAAQLSQDAHANRQVVENLRLGLATGVVEFGRFVEPSAFRGFEQVRLDEQLQQAQVGFHGQALRIEDLAESIRLGRPAEDFTFRDAPNAVYVPLVGVSDVVTSLGELTLKPQNYAQILVDGTRSDARFVARFLNSELGRSIREAGKSGATIRKLSTTGVRNLRVLVPALDTQLRMLEAEARIRAEQNVLLGLQNDLEAIRRRLWARPDQLAEVNAGLSAFSRRLSAGAGSTPEVTLEQWFETLPFPLASILRAWQATPSDDYKSRYEHLLHFFEALAEFLSVVVLSAYSSHPESFAEHRKRLAEAWRKQNVSLERATFGTWRVALEYLGKRTRTLLSANAEDRKFCGELFAAPGLTLPELVARKELASVLATTNKLRNDWTGHGGVVGPADARLRNEQLLGEVQALRHAMGDVWSQVRLVRALHCKPRQARFENEVAIMVGSNSEFLKAAWAMSSWLDVDRLYLVSEGSGRGLLLLPLLQVGPSPASAKNACYFFSRVERGGARFVSYHFLEQPELSDASEDTTAAIRSLLAASASETRAEAEN